MGTVMTGNVWFCILPSQRALIASTRSGQPQDPALSIRAKQRSIHNNYITFPLLFIMISNHFPSTGHPLNWLILFSAMIGGAGVRHFMNVRYAGKAWLVPALAFGVAGIGGMVAITTLSRPAEVAVDATRHVSFARVQEIITARCMACHSSHPTDPLAGATGTTRFDTPAQIIALAPRIKERVVVLKTMPFNNKTGITEDERAELGAWIAAGASPQ
jgi:uncharacterized membrane protein